MRKIILALVIIATLGVHGCLQEPSVPPRDLLTEVAPLHLNSNAETGGAAIFEHVFTVEEGLGPLFNANSCAECHEDPFVGGFGDEIERHTFETATLLHEFAVVNGIVVSSAEPAPQGEQIILRSSQDLFGIGAMDEETSGLTDADILAYVEAEEGVTPRLRILENGAIGRFGRKCVSPTLRGFVQDAFRGEMGIDIAAGEITADDVGLAFQFTNAIFNVPQGNAAKVSLADPGPGGGSGLPPDDRPVIHSVTGDFRDGGIVHILGTGPFTPQGITAAALPLQIVTGRPEGRPIGPPPGIPPGPPDVPPGPPVDPPAQATAALGQLLFRKFACAVCHNPATAYTDIALHNLSDTETVVQGQPVALEEFRTEPLPGIGVQTNFFHDGATLSLRDAITRHRGEGTPARLNFENAARFQQLSLLLFLGTL